MFDRQKDLMGGPIPVHLSRQSALDIVPMAWFISADWKLK